MTWDEAKAFCAKLTVGGRNDWHLPTIDELRYLIRGCAATQTAGSCGVTNSCRKFDCWKADSCKGCPERKGPGPDGAYWSPELAGPIDWYWSSTQLVNAGVPRAWLIAFGTADIYSTEVSFGNCARVACVRTTAN
jgi:formylglycine-generating enzyme required for sulfatase activity